MRNRSVLLGIILVISLSSIAFATEPDGATVTVGTPETKQPTDPGNVTADGGNITQVNLTAEVSTLAWQGFYGQVTGLITLEDNTGDVLYSWNVTNASGEVLASRNSTIDFTTVSGVTNCSTDEDLTGTGTDRVNNTFTNGTVSFEIASVSITAACNTFTYVNNATQTNRYQEIILNATGVTSIYVTKINDTTTSFDGTLQDYQMIVPDFSNTTTSTYYFFVEID
jgi:hypothetical protein